MARAERESRAMDERLDEALNLARAEAARPAPGALMARIEADALAHLPAKAARPRRRSAIGALLAQIGGWPALGGLATAGAIGLWLGIAPPAAVGGNGGWLDPAGDDIALALPGDYFDGAGLDGG